MSHLSYVKQIERAEILELPATRLILKCCLFFKKKEKLNSPNNQGIVSNSKAAPLKSTAFYFQKDFVFCITIDFYPYGERTPHNTKVISALNL